jgi:transposase InsO family protein
MTANTPIITQVVLSQSSDWRPWLQIIRTAAVRAKIWQYVDPDTIGIPPSCNEPEEPTYFDVNSSATGFKDLSSLEREELKDLKDSYKRQYKEYVKRDEGLSLLVRRIQETVDKKHHYLLDNLVSPYEMLVALKKRLSPTQKARERDLATAYRKLQEAPKDSDLDDWLSDWQIVYTQCKEANLPEVHDNRASIDFLNAIRSTDSYFAENFLHDIQKQESEGKDSLTVLQLLDEYETRRRIVVLPKPRTQPAFATLQGKAPEDKDKKDEDKDTNPRTNQQQSQQCPCGRRHRFGRCYYVIESIRPTGWKNKIEIQKKVEEHMKNNKDFKKAVEKARKEAKDKKAKEADESKEAKTDQKPPTELPASPDVSLATVFVGEAYATTSYHLQSSFILDCAATIHVCNDRRRFEAFKEDNEGHLITGDSTVPILGYGTVKVNADRPDGSKKLITLLNVAYAPTFLTNLMSLDLVLKGGCDWNVKKGVITKDEFVICSVIRKFKQFVVEYNPTNDQPNSCELRAETGAFVTKKSTKPLTSVATKDVWHRRLGHVSMEAIEHLTTALTGAKIAKSGNEVEQPEETEESPCEGCLVANLKSQISRRPSQRASRPFEKVHFDLIQMTPAFNGDKWALHFLCDKTRAYFGYTLKTKSDAREAVKDFAAFIKRQYGYDILAWHTDNEKSLEEAEFGQWIRIEGYIYETSAPYTPAQNGPAERSGGVIIQKSRALRIEGKLPANLWPETHKAAIYIINRTPTEQLDWKTPLEILNTLSGKQISQPIGAHLRILGSRAYVKIDNVKRTHKVDPRALIGYLVGYDSTNIFRIWIPQKRKVVRTRDVVFDENKRYNPKDPYVEDLLHTNMPARTFVIEVPAFRGRNEAEPYGIDEIESSDEEDEEMAATKTSSPEDTPSQTDSVSPLSEEQETADRDSEPSVSLPPLPTPSPTPFRSELSSPKSPEGEDYESAQEENHEPPPRREITSDVDTRNIITGPRQRRPTSRRREAYVTDLNMTEEAPGFFAAFSTGVLDTTLQPHRDEVPPEPENWKDMLKHPCKEDFLAGARLEVSELTSKKTFRHVDRPTGVQVIPLKWAFQYKYDTNGFIVKYKSRLCVRGDLQRLTLQDTFAATLAGKVFRMMMALTAVFDLDTTQFDVKNAFPHTDLDEVVYCHCPEGFEVPGKCLLLLKALYGLRRAPRLWQKKFTAKLVELGLKRVSEEPCLYMNDYLFLIFFIDDIIILSHKENASRVTEFKKRLMESFDIKDLGELKWFLGIRVIRDRPNRKLWLCQDSYIEKIANRFNLVVDKFPKTPMTTDLLHKNPDTATAQVIHSFQQKVGSLLYATVITRPDAARAAGKLGEFLMNPSMSHHDAADRLIQYLYGTRHLAIEFSSGSDTILCASDASFADNVDRKSSEGYLFKLFGGPVDWRATKQKTVTTSTTEAELLALSHSTKDFYWWKRLFTCIGLDLEDASDTPVLCDNKQTVLLLEREENTLKTQLKHVDVYNHWLRQEVQNRRVSIRWVPTSQMPADGFTKPLPFQRHKEFIQALNLRDVRHIIEAAERTDRENSIV